MFELEMAFWFLVIAFCSYMAVSSIKKGINKNKKDAEGMVKSYVEAKDDSDNFGVSNEGICINCPECGGKMKLKGNAYICDSCGYALKRDDI